MERPDITLEEAARYKQITDIYCDKMISLINSIKKDTLEIPITWNGKANEEFKNIKNTGDTEKINNVFSNRILFERIKGEAQEYYSQYVNEWDQYNRYLEEQRRMEEARNRKAKKNNGW